MDTQTIFNTNSNIIEDWQGGYKLQFDLTSGKSIADWKLKFDLPYNISAAYGVDVIENNNGTYTVKGQDGWSNLSDGQSIQPILIVEDNGQEAISPDFKALEPSATADPVAHNDSPSTEAQENSGAIDASSTVVEDWYGGYKLQVDIPSSAGNGTWQVDFALPHNISEVYGADLINNGEGNYTLQGQSTQAILIVEDNGGEALPLDFQASETTDSVEPATDNSSSEAEADFQIEATDATSDNNSPEAEADSQIEATNTAPAPSESAQDLEPNLNYGSVISVDNDFGGDIAAAIAAASDGEAIELSGRTYYTSGLTVDKDITIFGQEGATIDGGGTSNSIINLTPGASGATLDNIEITNGNNGIYSYGASNLTLQNLEVYDIGNSERFSGGQNNTGIILNYATGANLIDSNIYDVSRNGVSIGDTNGANISGLRVENINLAAQHAQSHDAAGIKFFNTNDVFLRDSYFANINANNIWNDTTNKTTIENNTIENVGSAFLKPSFNDNVDISGIYNEKSSNSVVKYNYASAIDNFMAYRATEFTTETMVMEGNDFSSIEINSQDYWVNESIEKLIAITEDPAEADFGLFSEEYFEVAVID